MKFVSCFLFVIAIEMNNVRKIESFEDVTIKLTTKDHRLDVVDGETYWEYSMDETSTSHVSNLQLGAGGQLMQIKFSTAEDTSWVTSINYDECDSNDKMKKIRKFFNGAASGGYTTEGENGAGLLLNYIKDLKYWMFGYMGKDSIYLENSESSSPLAVPVSFLEVRRASYRLTTGKADAAIALRYDSSDPYNNFVGKLCDNSVFSNKVFSFWFPRKVLGNRTNTRGELVLCKTIGYPRTVDNSVQFTKDIGRGEWRIELQRVGTLVGKDHTVLSRTFPTQATFDSSSDRIYGPSDEVLQFYDLAKVETHAKYQNIKMINCDRRDKLPNITFDVQGTIYTMTGVDYTEELMPHIAGENTICEVLIKPASINHWVLGESFFRAVYTVFDLTNRAVGFGRWNKWYTTY